MTAEEILVRLGINTEGFQQGLGNALNTADSFATKIGKQIGNKLSGAIIATMVIDVFKDLFDMWTKEIAKLTYDLAYKTSEGFGKVFDTVRGAYRGANQNRWIREAFDKELKQRQFEFRQIEAEAESLEKGEDPDTVAGKWAKVRRAREEVQHEAAAYEELEAHIADAVEMEEAAIKLKKTQRDLALAELELKQKLAEQEKKALDDKTEKQKKLNEKTAEQVELHERLMEVHRRGQAQYQPSLDELAQSGWRDMWGIGHSGPFAGMASQIMQLRDRAKQQFIYGNVAGANASIQESNRRYDRLADAGIVPERAEKVGAAQIQMAQDLREIKEGRVRVLVKPSNGK